jgi:gliding motility-associated-like protein
LKVNSPYIVFLILLLSFKAFSQPVANFTANRTSGCSPVTVQFTNTSTGNPTTFLWDFGNGNTSTLPNPSAIYVTPGTYTVTLTVGNGSVTNTKVVNAYITIYNNPIAEFAAAPVSGCIPLPVTFTDNTTVGGAPITSWIWDFGSGVTSTQQNPTNVYSVAGTYTVTLIVTDANGCQSSRSKAGLVTATVPFTTSFSASPTSACAPPLTTTFTPTVSPPGSYTYAWNFGNSNTSTTQNPAHTYTSNGNYTVELEVTSASGCKQKITQTGLVQIGGITPDFDIVAAGVCAPTNVTCQNKSTPVAPTNSFTWTSSFPTQTSTNALYNYTQTGSHSITLTAQSAAGCISSITKSFSLAQKPTASFTVSKSNFCETPASVSFSNTSVGSTSQNWNFGNAVTSTLVNPSVVYNAEGTFRPRLFAIGPQGSNCRDTAIATITVAKPKAEIVRRNQKKGCAPLTDTFEVIDQSLIPLTSWKWELNGVTISTNRLFIRTFTDTGVFVLKLTGTNSEGCEIVLFDEVQVGIKPIVNFTADKLNGCFNRTMITFTPTWTGVKPLEMRWDFEDGSSDEFIPIRLFTDTGLYTIGLTATYRGCSTEVIKRDYIEIFPPIADFSFKIDSCQTDSVQFIQRSIGRNAYVWNFGDATTSNLSNPRKVYVTPGTYKVQMIARDTVHNCYDTLSRSIIIINKPQVKFSPLDSAGCSPLRPQLRDLSIVDSSRTIRSWAWRVTPGNTILTGRNPNLNLSSPGLFYVKLEITDNLNCRYFGTDSSKFKVYGGSANFSLSANKGCVPFVLNVKDSAKAENGIQSRKWLWGNGDSTLVSDTFATYTYADANKTNQSLGFSVRLVVTDSQGCSFTSTRLVVPTKPVVTFTETRFKTCGKDSIRFGTTFSAGSILSPATALWRFPNNTQATGTSTFYNASGDTLLPFKLTLTDANGCIDSLVKQLRINTKPPTIQFDATPRNIPCYKSNTKVRFFDQTINGGNGIRFRRWLFGDNTGADSLPSPEKIYFIPGRYTVSLMVEDSAGCRDTNTIPDFVVVGGPFGSYSFTPKKGCTPTEVFFDVNTPNARLIIWDHADGVVDTFAIDTHRYVYTRPGVYYPRLTLIDSSLTCDFGYDAIDSIVVTPLPNPDFESNRTIICKGTSVLLTNTTAPHSSIINKWKWKLGTGDSIMMQGPLTYTYNTEGVFSISLQATDTLGCTNTIVKPDYITVNNDTIPPATPLVKRATVMSNDSVLFEYKPNAEFDFAKYVIYHNTSATQKDNINDTAFFETGLNTTEFTYQYQMAAVDVCNNQSPTSEIHRTIELKAIPDTNAIRLAWTHYLGFDTLFQYAIWRKGVNDADYVVLDTLPAQINQYKDTSVLCYSYYTYQIKAIETSGYLQFSWSDTSGAAPIYINTLPFTQNIRATVIGNAVRLEWNLRTHYRSFEYQIYRAVDGNPPSYFKTMPSTDTVLIDTDVDVNAHTYSYTTYLVDACGGMSQPSNVARSILLTVYMVDNDILKHDPKLTWTPYTKWDNGVHHYNATFLNEVDSRTDLVTRTDSLTLTATHKYINLVQDDYCYLITAYQQGDTSIISESNLACVSTEPRLFAPNVFTVNGDNLNDVYYIRGLFIETFELSIYDRWGKMVFQTNNINQGWDGTINGEIAKSDVYVYKAEATGKKGQRISITGNITLMR